MKILYQAWIAAWFEVDSQIWQIQKEIALNQLDIKREECIIAVVIHLFSSSSIKFAHSIFILFESI